MIVSDEIVDRTEVIAKTKVRVPTSSRLMCFRVNPKDAMTRGNSLICGRLIEEIRLGRKPCPAGKTASRRLTKTKSDIPMAAVRFGPEGQEIKAGGTAPKD
jgi:hypothetical protein